MTQLTSCGESDEAEHEWQHGSLCHRFFPLAFRGQTLGCRPSKRDPPWTNMQEGSDETGKLPESDLVLSARVAPRET